MTISKNYLCVNLRQWSNDISENINYDKFIFNKIVACLSNEKLIPQHLRNQISSAKNSKDRAFLLVQIKNALPILKKADVKAALGEYINARGVKRLEVNSQAARSARCKSACASTATKVLKLALLSILIAPFLTTPTTQPGSLGMCPARNSSSTGMCPSRFASSALFEREMQQGQKFVEKEIQPSATKQNDFNSYLKSKTDVQKPVAARKASATILNFKNGIETSRHTVVKSPVVAPKTCSTTLNFKNGIVANKHTVCK